jgi:Uma2 family endonuclease
MAQVADVGLALPAASGAELQEDDRTQLTDPSLAMPLVLRMRPPLQMDDEQFFVFCQQNSDLQIERTAEGDLIIMSPVGGETGDRESELSFQVRLWAKTDGTGVAFSPSTGFTLPNRAKRSPDAAWVLRERLTGLRPQEKKRFLPLCPDFVAELLSPSDSLPAVQEKMQEYMDNGARLGWLIDPENRRVYIYRTNAPVERLDDPASVPGDPELPGFVLDAQAIFNPGF